MKRCNYSISGLYRYCLIAIAIVNIVVITGCASTQYGQKNKITTINSDKNQRVAISSSLETSGRVCIEAPPFTKSATADSAKIVAGDASVEGSKQTVLVQNSVLEIIKSGYYFACQDYLNNVFHDRGKLQGDLVNLKPDEREAYVTERAAEAYLERVKDLDKLLAIIAICQPSGSGSIPALCNNLDIYNLLLSDFKDVEAN